MQNLPSQHCHIYYADAHVLPEDVSLLLARLSKEERSRVQQMVFERDQRQTLCAHLLKRTVLAQYCSVSASDLVFATTDRGKPYLPQFPRCQFNLSHSQGRVLLAIRQDSPIGVDIEQPRQRLHPKELAARNFSAQENELINLQSQELQDLLFYRLWVAKEAILKAQGVGIAHHLAEVELQLRDDGLIIKHLPQSFGDSASWCFREVSIFENAVSAFASPQPIQHVEIFSANLS